MCIVMAGPTAPALRRAPGELPYWPARHLPRLLDGLLHPTHRYEVSVSLAFAFTHGDVTLIVVAMIGAGSTLFATRKNRRLILEETNTYNGAKLGKTVHDIAQTVEVVAAQTHVMQGWMLSHDEKHHAGDEEGGENG